MRGFWSELAASFMNPIRFIFFIAVSIFVGVIGPFGTFGVFSVPLRLAYWGLIVFLSYILVLSLRLFYQKLFGKMAPYLLNALVFFTVSVILTPVIIVITQPLIPDGYSGYKPEWTLGFFIFFVGLFIDFVRYVIAEALKNQNPSPERSEPRLNDRIPEEFKGEILQISGKDHHVRVRTSRGVTEIRLRLADAINEMEGVDGICPHRSHWVAISAVVGHGVNETSGAFYLTLSDRTRVPVTRANEPLVRERGLLGDTKPK